MLSVKYIIKHFSICEPTVGKNDLKIEKYPTSKKKSLHLLHIFMHRSKSINLKSATLYNMYVAKQIVQAWANKIVPQTSGVGCR